jgi:hypothetical protein
MPLIPSIARVPCCGNALYCNKAVELELPPRRLFTRDRCINRLGTDDKSDFSAILSNSFSTKINWFATFEFVVSVDVFRNSVLGSV